MIEGCCPFYPVVLDLNTFLNSSQHDGNPSGICSGPLSAIAVLRHIPAEDTRRSSQSIPRTSSLQWTLTLETESYGQRKRSSKKDYEVGSLLTKETRKLVTRDVLYLPNVLHVRDSAPAIVATENSNDLEDAMVRIDAPIPGGRIVFFPEGLGRGTIIVSPLSAVAANATEFLCWSAHYLPASSHQATELRRHFDKLVQSSASTS